MNKLTESLCYRSRVLLAIASVIACSFFVIETLVISRVLSGSVWNIVVYILIIILFLLGYIIIRDFIERSELRQEKLNAQLNAIDKSHLITIMDLDGNITFANKNFCKLIGHTVATIKEKNHRDIIPTYVSKTRDYQMFWRSLKFGKPIFGEFELINRWGVSVWIQGNYTPLKNQSGHITYILQIAIDRTADHHAQVEIIQKNSYLEYAAKILRHEMNSGINIYIPRGLTSLKRRLTKQQIHDLNIESPLKMIEGGLEHAQRVYNGVREFTNIVKTNSKMNKTLCNLNESLNKFIQTTAYSKQVILDDLPTLYLNESLFCTAIDNLIRNGLKYNDSETKLVRIYMLKSMTLCVEDNGRGMSQEEFEYLSKPYTRKPKQAEAGSGLGLNICVAIFKEHGFTMTAEKLEQGTRIKIKLGN